MRLKIKNKYNLILGVIVGFVLGQLVIAEGYAILVSINQKQGIIEYGLSKDHINLVKFIALIVFIITILIFNIKKINLNKLNIYILIALIISIFITIEIFAISVSIIGPGLINYMPTDYFLSMNIGLIIVGIGIVIFIIIFILFINKKVKYIAFLTKEVKKIKNEGFGKTIEVKGEDELADLCKSINEMSLELSEKIENEKKIEATKNELITNISHDLKTPLTSIMGYLELLNRENISDEVKSDYTKIAYKKSLRLNTLVNELFEYTKLNSPDIELKKVEFNISNLINQIVGESILGFLENNIEVVLENPYEVIIAEIDVRLITRVLENLIKNAEKYSDPNSIFKIKVIEKNEKIEIQFINKCEQIKEENLLKIFEKFYRRDESRSDEIEGSGLGLNIAKRIIELHDGTLEVEKDGDYINFKVIIRGK